MGKQDGTEIYKNNRYPSRSFYNIDLSLTTLV